MAIVNRDLDASEQRSVSGAAFGVVGTGVTLGLFVAPWACEVQAVRLSAVGLSGAPTGALSITRFAGGATTITGGWTTLTLTAVGTSGIQSFTQVATGSSLIALGAGDVLAYTSGAANAAASISVAVVVKCLVDIKNQFNNF